MIDMAIACSDSGVYLLARWVIFLNLHDEISPCLKKVAGDAAIPPGRPCPFYAFIRIQILKIFVGLRFNAFGNSATITTKVWDLC